MKMCIRDSLVEAQYLVFHEVGNHEHAVVLPHHVDVDGSEPCLLYTSLMLDNAEALGDETGGGNGHLVLVVEPCLLYTSQEEGWVYWLTTVDIDVMREHNGMFMVSNFMEDQILRLSLIHISLFAFVSV